nr:MAG TPA: hypothetical protein [Caudoviricetes sp.]
MIKVDGKTMTRREMLDDMDVRCHPDGRRRVISIKYVDKQGRLRFIPQGTVGGAGKMNNKQFRLRGVTPCDCKGHAEDHVHPVNIHHVIMYNNRFIFD